MLQIRQHVASAIAAERSHHARHLLHTLVDLAEETSSWTAVLKLPFSAAEQAELAALLRDPRRASAAGKLPLMLLQRGRLAEALTAAAKLPPGPQCSPPHRFNTQCNCIPCHHAACQKALAKHAPT